MRRTFALFLLAVSAGAFPLASLAAETLLARSPSGLRAWLIPASAGSGEIAGLRISRPKGSERSASAPGASGAGLSIRNAFFSEGALVVEHRGGDSSRAVSWRTEWAWAPGASEPRLLRSARAVGLPDGSVMADSVDWESGERLRAAPDGSLKRCLAERAAPPAFASLSAASLESGAFLLGCAPRDLQAPDPEDEAEASGG